MLVLKIGPKNNDASFVKIDPNIDGKKMVPFFHPPKGESAFFGCGSIID
jgi:hypothetical protein